MSESQGKNRFPALSPLGLDGVLLRFADHLSESANEKALALRAALTAAQIPGVEEVAAALASVYLRFDPAKTGYAAVAKAALASLDELAKHPLPLRRRRWHIPTAFGGDSGPQLAEAAALAGLSPEAAINEIAATPLRVMSLGFAPGQPYLGLLPEHWDIPRQAGLTKEVPLGALTVAIRQFVLFATSAPTGWRHIGQTAFAAFCPNSPEPFRLRPGDEVVFTPTRAEALPRLAPRLETRP